MDELKVHAILWDNNTHTHTHTHTHTKEYELKCLVIMSKYNSVLIYSMYIISSNRLIGQADSVFANGPGDLFQFQVTSYQRLKKWYLKPPYLILSIIRYVSRVKWSNPGKGVAPFPTSRCSSYWKGSLLVPRDYGRRLYLILISSKKITDSTLGILTLHTLCVECVAVPMKYPIQICWSKWMGKVKHINFLYLLSRS